MTTIQAGIKPRVDLDGRTLPAELDVLLERVVVDDHLHLPDMVELTFRDAANDVLRKLGVQIGSRVSVAASAGGAGSPEVLIDGEVTALEADYGAGGSRAVVRGYDGSHRLHRGRFTQTYRNVKHSDIAGRIARQVGLEPGTIDDTRTTHEHVSQVNVSYWEFLTALAGEVGFEVAVSEGRLHFRRPRPASQAPAEGGLQSSDPLQLVCGRDLIEFRPRISSAEQVKEVKVRGWDPGAKRAVIGSATASSASSQVGATPAGLARTFGDPGYLAFGIGSYQTVVDDAARAIAERIGSAVAEVDGIAIGSARLRAGTPISVGMVAAEFAGRYTLTHTRHVFDSHGYRTLFEVSGRQDRSLLGLVTRPGAGGQGAGGTQPIYGVVFGQVTNNDDPDHLGRVRLKFPWLSDSYESDWARMVQAGAGPDSGACFLPEVNDEVLVAFEFGDVRRPLVMGGLHNGTDKPRLGDGLVDNGRVKRRGFVSRKGHRVVLLDDDSKSGIALLSSDGSLKVALNETRSEIHISCQGSIRIEAQGQLELKGAAGVKVESDGEVEVSGALIKLN
jgi:phage protein D